jgi:hypothetical protein
MSKPLELLPDDETTPQHQNEHQATRLRSKYGRGESADVGNLIADMNEIAGKDGTVSFSAQTDRQTKATALRRSPRKRRSDGDAVPANTSPKRLRTAPTNMTSPENKSIIQDQSRSTKLQRSKRVALPRPSQNRRNVFEIDNDEPETASQAGMQQSRPTLRKVRLLRKKNDAGDPSPFKNHGTIEMPTSRQVNLDDSPSKRPLRGAKNLSATVRDRVVTEQITAESEPSAKKDPATGQNNSFAGPGKGMNSRPERSRAQQVESAQSILLPGHHSRAVLGRTDSNESGNEDSDDYVDNDDNDDRDEDREENGDHSENATTAAATNVRPAGDEEAREESESEGQARKAEIKDIERIVELYGCGRAWSDLFVAISKLTAQRYANRCETTTGKSLCRRIQLLKDFYRKVHEPSGYDEDEELQDSKAVIRLVTREIWIHSTAHDSSPNEKPRKARDLYGHIIPRLCRVLKRILLNRQIDGKLGHESYRDVRGILSAAWNAADYACNWTPRPSMLTGGALKLMRDYVRPSLKVLCDRYSARRNRSDDQLSETARLDHLAELQKRDREALRDRIRQRYATILERNSLRHKSAELAQSSRPDVVDIEDIDTTAVHKPGVLDSFPITKRRQGGSGLGSQRERFSPILNQGTTRTRQDADEFSEDDVASFGDNDPEPVAERDVLNTLEERQKKDQQKLWAKRQRRYALVLNRANLTPQSTGVAAASEQGVIEIDDISSIEDVDLGVPSPPTTPDETLPVRPAPFRAQTEEIPGPVQPAWTWKEQRAFVKLLEHFTGPARFEDILTMYGGPSGLLERHDLDSLMSQAKNIKGHMASHLREAGPELNWLRSVPG